MTLAFITPSEGLLVFFTSLLLLGFGIYIWFSIPLVLCPECFSYDVDDSDSPLRCKDCGHEFRLDSRFTNDGDREEV